MAKRAIDILVSLTALVALAPLMLAISACIRLMLGTPVLLRQRRPGLNGALFTLLKFRSMRDAADGSTSVPHDEERLTPLGRVLRRTSLDELPQLFNVLRGQMSIVGPRPLLPQYLDRYNERQARRHEVRPGLTGLTQVRGRNRLSWEERLELDVQYVERRSLWLDARIMWWTAGTVLCGDGVNQPGYATSEEFLGTAHGDKIGH